MYEIQLKDFISSANLRFRRADRLSEIVKDAEMDMRRRFRDSNLLDKDLTSRIISDFCSIYGALDQKFSQLGVFKKNGTDSGRLSKVWSLYNAAVAVENRLADDSVERLLQNQETDKYFSKITENDFTGPSDISIIGTVLQNLKSVTRSKHAELEKYNLYVFFDTARLYSRDEVLRNCEQATRDMIMNRISIALPDYDFRDMSQKRRKPQPKKGDPGSPNNRSTVENIEKLPDRLPAYSQIYPDARLDNVVGNIEGQKVLLASFNQMLDFDPVKCTNPHMGRGYLDRLIIHGMQGTAKNYTVDAVISSGLDISKHLGTRSQVVTFKKEIRSIYKDRTAQMFNHYAKMALESGIPTLVLLNEADGLFSVGQNGKTGDETYKLIADAKEVMDETGGRNIIWWLITNNPGVFKDALGERFYSVSFPGIQTVDDCKSLFEIKLKQSKAAKRYDVTEGELFRIAEKYMARKDDLWNRHRIYLSGRGVAEICDKFVAFDLDTYLNNMMSIHRLPADRKDRHLDRIRPVVTFERLDQGVTSYFKAVLGKERTHDDYSAQYRGTG